jgi:hypothetical protein
MPEVKDIHPLWSVRPVGPRPSRKRDDSRAPGPERPAQEDRDAGDDEEEGPRHVDEYA